MHRSGRHARLGRRTGGGRDAKVHDPDRASPQPAEHEVGGLDVPVDQAPAVKVAESIEKPAGPRPQPAAGNATGRGLLPQGWGQVPVPPQCTARPGSSPGPGMVPSSKKVMTDGWSRLARTAASLAILPRCLGESSTAIFTATSRPPARSTARKTSAMDPRPRRSLRWKRPPATISSAIVAGMGATAGRTPARTAGAQPKGRSCPAVPVRTGTRCSGVSGICRLRPAGRPRIELEAAAAAPNGRQPDRPLLRLKRVVDGGSAHGRNHYLHLRGTVNRPIAQAGRGYGSRSSGTASKHALMALMTPSGSFRTDPKHTYY